MLRGIDSIFSLTLPVLLTIFIIWTLKSPILEESYTTILEESSGNGFIRPFCSSTPQERDTFDQGVATHRGEMIIDCCHRDILQENLEVDGLEEFNNNPTDNSDFWSLYDCGSIDSFQSMDSPGFDYQSSEHDTTVYIGSSDVSPLSNITNTTPESNYGFSVAETDCDEISAQELECIQRVKTMVYSTNCTLSNDLKGKLTISDYKKMLHSSYWDPLVAFETFKKHVECCGNLEEPSTLLVCGISEQNYSDSYPLSIDVRVSSHSYTSVDNLTNYRRTAILEVWENYRAGFCVFSGRDHSGRPLIWLRVKYLHPSAISLSCGIRSTWLSLDAAFVDEVSQRTGVCLVYDFRDIGYENITLNPRYVMKGISACAIDHPSKITRVIFLNTPRIFWIAWRTIKEFLPENLKRVFEELKETDIDWPNSICTTESLPTYLGGQGLSWDGLVMEENVDAYFNYLLQRVTNSRLLYF